MNCCSNCMQCTWEIPLGVLLPPLIVENVLIGIAIGLIFWKRIKVAKYLQNYEPPKCVQALLRRWRQPSPLPDLEDNIERTLHNPMYDMKEGESSKANTAEEAKEPAEMYEDILDLPGPKERSDVYDVPDVGRESLVAYATTDVSGKHMLGAYAVTEISQSENSHCGAYAVSGLLDGNSASETLECISAEVHVENGSHSNDKEEVEEEPSQRPAAESCQKDTEIGNSDNNISSPAKDQLVLQSSASASGRGKTTSQSSNGPKPPVRSKPPIASSKPSLRPSNRNESRENLVSTRTSDAASEGHRVRVMFKDEDRRRSQSYAGVRWEDGKTEQVKVLTRSAKRASLKGKPPPLSKKPSLHLKGVRERGASDSGVQEYSKLDVKNQYASLEPHVGKEMDSIDESKNNLTKESYSQLQH